MFRHVIEAKYLEEYRVWIKFNNGKSGEIDLSHEIWGEIFEPLKKKNYFKSFKVENDTLSWKNGADFAPEFLYELLKQQTKTK
jgi:hypothetical protein